MKKVLFILVAILLSIAHSSTAQVSTNYNNDIIVSAKGQFQRNYGTAIDFVIPSKNIDSLLSKEKRDIAQSNELKPFKLAEPISVNLDIPKLINWTNDEEFSYGKFTLKLSGALSTSINFNKFYLPKNTELFVYNENGRMITGPVTEKENNQNGIWGSWVYQGELLTIEIKTPIASKNELILHSNNVAYGYKEIYKSIKVGGFGTSGPCNINVICPLGVGWEGERNSVSTILSANGGEFCTGSLVMNTCGTNTPYFLTANHCFELGNSNVPGWRFAFQAWSTTCPNPGVNTNGVMYNGATLRARNAATDFCLVELNQTPPANSGLHYAGWNRSTTPAQNATCIHHPSGDLMKISRANNPVTVASAFGTTNQHWRANWSQQNNGNGQIVTAVTEPGSSGSPLFDQNRRIVGQLHGGPSACNATQLWDFYGRFDLSWTGGGTNATRLSNWLDAANLGTLTTNTTNINALTTAAAAGNLTMIGATSPICNNTTLTINGASPSATVSWSSSNTSIASVTSNGLSTFLTKNGNGIVIITATIIDCGRPDQTITQTYEIGTPVVTWPEVFYPTTGCLPMGFNVTYTTTSQFQPYGYEWGYYEGPSGNNSPYVLVGTGGTQQAIRITNTETINRISVKAINACGAGVTNIREFTFSTGCDAGGDVEYRTIPNEEKTELTKDKFSIIGNPANSYLILKVPQDNLKKQIAISDIHGRILVSITNGTSPIIKVDISQLKSGVYFVSLLTKDKKQNLKFIKQ